MHNGLSNFCDNKMNVDINCILTSMCNDKEVQALIVSIFYYWFRGRNKRHKINLFVFPEPF